MRGPCLPAPRRNFTAAEDLILCRAFVNATTNQLRGADMRATVFWGGIADSFHDLCNQEPSLQQTERRSIDSLKNRWQKKISRDREYAELVALVAEAEDNNDNEDAQNDI